jgi:hypothetical protein
MMLLAAPILFSCFGISCKFSHPILLSDPLHRTIAGALPPAMRMHQIAGRDWGDLLVLVWIVATSKSNF